MIALPCLVTSVAHEYSYCEYSARIWHIRVFAIYFEFRMNIRNSEYSHFSILFLKQITSYRRLKALLVWLETLGRVAKLRRSFYVAEYSQSRIFDFRIFANTFSALLLHQSQSSPTTVVIGESGVFLCVFPVYHIFKEFSIFCPVSSFAFHLFNENNNCLT